MDRNLALEMIRVTEASALAAAGWMGRGDASAATRAATDAMHETLNSIPFTGRIAIGEGEVGSVKHLYSGEMVGVGGPTQYNLVLDPLECTRSVAFGRSNAMSVVAMAPEDCFYVPPTQYLEKLAVGPEAAHCIDLDLSIEDNLKCIAGAKNYSISDLTVVILDRERHSRLIERVRDTGARIHLIPDGDVAAAIAAATPGTGVDVLMGTGGAAAGVLAAAALRCLGGELLSRLAPFDQDETERAAKHGVQDIKTVFRAVDLVRGDDIMFAATGVTDGDLLNGVAYRADGATTHSLVVRSKSRTRRYIVTEHFFDDSPEY